jgi:uncharacterized SAM-binding protein YcdF (DUF218 family)
MFFILSKTLGVLTRPSNLMLSLGCVGAVLLTNGHVRTGLGCLFMTIVLLASFGLSPLSNALILPLKRRFPRWDLARGEPHGIVILGGGGEERIASAIELARKYPKAQIVFSGGSGRLFSRAPTEAGLAKRRFELSGVPAGRLITEDRSRNTAENARFTKAAIGPKPGERWLLVTSAYHMPRAMGTFRGAGFPVEAYPVEWRAGSRMDAAHPYRMALDGLKRTDTAVHEWIGLFVYWLTGRSSELFPRP